MAEIEGRKRYCVFKGKSVGGKSNKTTVFSVCYLRQCGCGYEEEVTRKIELKETQTLDDLHEAIIYKAFKWDDPHMYSFFFDNTPCSSNRKREYSCNAEPDLEGETPNNPWGRGEVSITY